MENNEMKCTKCGNEFEGHFCNKCGNPVNGMPEQQNGAYIQPPINVQVNQMPRKKKMGCFVVGLIVVGGIILTLIFIGIIGSLRNDVKSTTGSYDESSSTTSSDAEGQSEMTYSNYEKIETGMSYDEVVEITNAYGKEISSVEIAGIKTVILSYEGSGSFGANATVTFQNGEVIAKAQIGLE